MSCANQPPERILGKVSINSEQINDMPLVTRNYETLMNLQPGVAFGGGTDDLTRGPSGLSGSSSTVNFSVNGGRNTQNNWTIDGADNVDRGANLTLYTYPSPDAIAEFKTLARSIQRAVRTQCQRPDRRGHEIRYQPDSRQRIRVSPQRCLRR